jgi:hypothetical protein
MVSMTIKYGDVLRADGDTWLVLGAGATRSDGSTYVHLSSQTRSVSQKNGKRPVQCCGWYLDGKLS